MANNQLTADIIAKEALVILKNNTVMSNKVHRAHEKEFSKNVNGYKVGSTVSIQRPADFTVRSGRTASIQDVVEGSTSLTVDTQEGVDFKFTSEELTMNIGQLSKRVLEPALIQLSNSVDQKLMGLYKQVPNWVGTPGEDVNAFTDFSKAPERMDEYAVPQSERCGVLSASDHWALAGAGTTLYDNTIIKPAYRKGETGMIGGVDLYMSQNVPTHTVGAIGGSVLVDQALTTSTTTYESVKSTMLQTLHVDGLTAATAALAAGDVFTIAGVFAVNPVTKARLPFLKQFTVTADAIAASNEVDLVIYPAMIWSGAQQNISTDATDLNNAAVTFMGTAATGYRQNMVFHKNAFALAMVPMEMPAGATGGARQSYDGLSVRVQPYYDGTNDESAWRLDILYGVKAIDPRLAVRLSGTA